MHERSPLVSFFSATKLYWGLAVLFVIGIIISPETVKGTNIFLSQSNLSNVLRQVSNNGILAVGMTLVILTAGIDLSVGTMMAMGSTLAAMLITLRGWSSASYVCIPVTAIIVLFFTVNVILSIVSSWRIKPYVKTFVSLIAGLAAASALAWWCVRQVPSGVGVISVLIA
ncbi:MAG: ABC transporter permease, partial [bacterium]